MITLSLNFAGITGKDKPSHEKKVRKLVDTHLAFPGADKLKLGLTVKDSGYSAVTFAGPREVIAEAKRLWSQKIQPAAKQVQSKFKAATTKAKTKVKKAAAPIKKKVKATVPKRKVVKAKAKAKVSVSKKKKKR